jgi:chaperone required for assembly of F1-ATPase
MRDILQDLAANQPLDPTESARRNMRPQLRGRFYKRAEVRHTDAGFAVELDGKTVRTPARNALVAPSRPIAEAMAAEWNAQTETIDPARMPLTRLANSVLDGVAAATSDVAAEIVKYLGTDLLFYRADAPQGLVARQSELWDPVLDWANYILGARFMLAEGVMFVAQPETSIARVSAVIPRDPWRLGALHVVTTLTGSALLALAVACGKLDAEAAWAAAHVDEDWQMSQWGKDEIALQRRAFRWEDMDAATTVLAHLPQETRT